MNVRREALEYVSVEVAEHAGLWFDKYLKERKKEVDHVRETAGIAISDIYKKHFYPRWKSALEAQGAKVRRAQTSGRMITGLGGASVIETGIALHQTYGVPYIPGSSLKGLAASYAVSRLGADWKPGTPRYVAMFGTTASAGYVHFHDALYVPCSGKFPNKPLVPDVMTVHHQKYYSEGKVPADWDDPVIVPFLSVSGDFLVALSGPEAWVEAAFTILAYAMRAEGAGAKTNAGYGRMSMESATGEATMPPPPTLPQAPPTETYDIARRRLLADPVAHGRNRGTLARLSNDHTFGFINQAKGGQQLYISVKKISPAKLKIGQVYEYTVKTDAQGTHADDVVLLLEP